MKKLSFLLKVFLYEIHIIRKRYKINPLRLYKFLLKSQYYNIKEIETFQLKAFNKLVNSIDTAYYPYLKPISKLADLQNFPVIDKSFVRLRESELINIKYKPRFIHKTSGSTGAPIKIYLNALAEAYRIAGRFRFKQWWGIGIFDKGVLIWGTEGHKKISLFSNLLSEIFPTLRINVFDLNDKTIISYCKEIIKYEPVYVRGYKSGIVQFAKLIDKNNISTSRLKFKVAIVTSEVLLKEERDLISKILNCPVANEYGSVEAGLYAYECPNGGMHVFEESLYTFSNANNEIVSTELHNYCTPLINYKNDDKVIFSNEPCKCGRTLKTISEIQGRLDDFVQCPDGRELSQYILYYMFKTIDGNYFPGSVDQYKVLQKKFHFKIQVVKGSNWKNEVISFITEYLKKNIGNDITIEFEFLPAIPREKSGKLRFFKKEI
jgi:phenylacetate-CoA ligase